MVIPDIHTITINSYNIVIRVPQIQIKSNIRSIWIWSNQINPDLNLIWFNIWIWIWFEFEFLIVIFKSNQIFVKSNQIFVKSNQIWPYLNLIKSNIIKFEFELIKYLIQIFEDQIKLRNPMKYYIYKPFSWSWARIRQLVKTSGS